MCDVSICQMTAIRASKEIQIIMKLNHVAILRFDISIQIYSCLEFIKILSVTSSKFFRSLKNSKKSVRIHLNKILRSRFVSYFT